MRRNVQRQCRYTAITEARQPLVSATEADPCFRSKSHERHTLIEMPRNQAFPNVRSQSGQWLVMHGG